MRLADVYGSPAAPALLYRLMEERTPEVNTARRARRLTGTAVPASGAMFRRSLYAMRAMASKLSSDILGRHAARAASRGVPLGFVAGEREASRSPG